MAGADQDLALREPAGPPHDEQDLLSRTLRGMRQGREDPLDEIATYALVPAGKLLRPLLVLEAARAVGGVAEDVAGSALALEFLHVATLVHDDIIDGDALRRGRASVPARFGVDSAIVSGDGLLLETFATLTAHRPPDATDADVVAVVDVMASAGLEVCRGQLLESRLVGDLGCTVERYLEMARAKTGALFTAACRIGGILGGGRPEWVEALGEFGGHLGAVFQIRDDLLPFDDGAVAVGKRPESDLLNRRPTLPVLMAHRSASPPVRAELESLFAADPPAAASFGLLLEIVESTGARAAAEAHARATIGRALDCLATLPAGDHRVLAGVVEHALDRAS